MTTEKIRELKEHKNEEARGYEWIAGMSAQFNERMEQMRAVWQGSVTRDYGEKMTTRKIKELNRDDDKGGYQMDGNTKQVKEKMDRDELGFEWIVGMSSQFNHRISGDQALTPEEASYWQLRILLAIAQQLSVIAGALKEDS